MAPLEPLSARELDNAVGITTTVPMELLFAAGLRPVDLNNGFITSGEGPALVEEAERDGFPRNSCAWIKGCYGAARRLGLKRVVIVTQGDCSSTRAMGEVLTAEGVETLDFGFPHEPDRRSVRASLKRFARTLGVTLEAGEAWKRRLDPIRHLVWEIDGLCRDEGRVTGEESHVWQISCSDFNGDPDRFAGEARVFLREAWTRPATRHPLRVALVGIPPIFDGMYDLLDSLGVRVTFEEIPRQFTMCPASADLVTQYTRYTYPYSIFVRLPDIRDGVIGGACHGVIHYVQSFCFRQVQDSLLRREVDLPILTLEGDRPGPVDGRTRTRIEAFIEMLPGWWERWKG